jgi:uncharacterized protein (DUF1778 family)
MTSEREEFDKEIAELESRKDTDRELEGFVPVKARISKNLRSMVSIRMSPSELSEIVAAAGVVDQNVSEFIREMALKGARQVRAGVEEARNVVLARAEP